MKPKLIAANATAIEKGIPIPPRPSGEANAKYPWRIMEIGDSFFIATTTPNQFYARASEKGRRYSRCFTCRKVDGGVRIWRTA